MNIPEGVPVDSRYANGIGKGWFTLVEELHKQMVAIDPGYTIQQIKEKFGGLRYYWEPHEVDGFSDYSDKPAIEAMCALVDYATALSYHICEECGSPGKIRDGGWIRTLCDEHV